MGLSSAVINYLKDKKEKVDCSFHSTCWLPWLEAIEKPGTSGIKSACQKVRLVYRSVCFSLYLRETLSLQRERDRKGCWDQEVALELKTSE